VESKPVPAKRRRPSSASDREERRSTVEATAGEKPTCRALSPQSRTATRPLHRGGCRNRYDDLEAAVRETPSSPAKSEDEKRQEAIDLVMETIEALATDRGAEDKIWGSMVKQALKRRRPGFSEAYYGFSSFSRLLSEAEARKLIELDHDEKSGGVIIKSFVAD
jgi:hypothetical protein